MKNVWFKDCKVIREPGKTFIVDKKTQETVFSIDAGWYTDDQLQNILRIYNTGLKAGICQGRKEKQDEIKKVIGV